MIVRTAQEQNSANCCGCDAPECAEPRKVCESAPVGLCAFSPDSDAPVSHPDPEEGAILYQSMGYLYEGSGTTDITENTATASDLYTYGENCGVELDFNYFDDAKYWHDSSKTQLQTRLTNTYTAAGVDEGSGISMTKDWTNQAWDSEGEVINDESGTTSATHSFTGFIPTYASGGSWAGAVLSYEAVKHHSGLDDNPTTLTFSSPYTPSTASAVMDSIELDDGDFSVGSCSSSVVVTMAADNIRIKAASGIKARIKFGVPASYAGSVWEMTWDYVEASDDWWTWFDGGMIGTEPTPGPSLVSSDSWTWGGSMATEADQFSDWKEIPIPTIPGECRVVNILVKCYNSTRLGVKPTAYGDQIAIP